ncbi:transposon-encoded TnpW family protein [Agathobaculum sp. Marseille-P7918]|uniref:transposon-encoded TnpW family protein n=1 Tax=Agathobaculum sp. Marseille-P7918 TaxID=2479843 RepID=UPI00356280A1
MSEEPRTMQPVDTTSARAPEDAPALVKKIGRTTYKVRVHFSQTSTETMSDKIKRMLKNEVRMLRNT